MSCRFWSLQAMKGEKGIAGVSVGEGLSEELTDDFSKLNPTVRFSLLLMFFMCEFVCSKPTSCRDHYSRRPAAERHGVHHLISAGKPLIFCQDSLTVLNYNPSMLHSRSLLCSRSSFHDQTSPCTRLGHVLIRWPVTLWGEGCPSEEGGCPQTQKSLPV